jgi:hypothetical protein
MKVSVAIVEKCRERERHEQCAFAAGTYALPRYPTAPADAADDQIVFFAGIGRRRPGFGRRTAADGAVHAEGSVVGFPFALVRHVIPENLGPEAIFWIR